VRFVIKSTATFCLLLTIWSAVGFAAHHHSNSTESAKCTVCVAAHTSAPRATAAPQKVTLTHVIAVPAEPLAANEAVVAFALSVRPPPAA